MLSAADPWGPIRGFAARCPLAPLSSSLLKQSMNLPGRHAASEGLFLPRGLGRLVDPVQVGGEFGGAQVGDLVQHAAVGRVLRHVGEEPVLPRRAGQQVRRAVVEDRGAGARRLQEEGPVDAGGRRAGDVGQPGGVVPRRGPLRQDGGQGRLVAVEGGAARDQDVVGGVADEAVGPQPADEEVPVAAADQQVVAGAAFQDVVAVATLEAVVAVAAVQPWCAACSRRPGPACGPAPTVPWACPASPPAAAAARRCARPSGR